MPTPPLKQKAQYFLKAICGRFPEAKIELNYDPQHPWQLLVAVVLSAQTTDVGVNKVTPALFARFLTTQDFANSTAQEIEPYIKTLGFFRVKARNLVAAAQMIMDRFNGQVPRSRTELESLPGVGAKSAAVIIANAFGTPALAVDTHVGRVARRLGLTRELNPSKVEKELTLLFSPSQLLTAHHAFIWHGRRICKAKKPACPDCPVNSTCPKIGVKNTLKPASPFV